MLYLGIKRLERFKRLLALAEGKGLSKLGQGDLVEDIGTEQYTKGNGIVIAHINNAFERCSCLNKQFIFEYEIFENDISVGRFKYNAIGIYFERDSYSKCSWKFENRKAKKCFKTFMRDKSIAQLSTKEYITQETTIC